MCAVLEVSRSGFYAWCQRGPSDREQQDGVLAEKIREIHRVNRCAYGSPRVFRALRLEGYDYGQRLAPTWHSGCQRLGFS